MALNDNQQDALELEIIDVIGPAMERGIGFDIITGALLQMIAIVEVAAKVTAAGAAGEAWLDEALKETRKGMH